MPEIERRRRNMGILAAAPGAALAEAVQALGALPPATELRKPEIGMVMLRGRTGGDGAAFNVGEATVARSVMLLESGEIGYGFRLGRDLPAARLSAMLDALWQSPDWREKVETSVISPLSQRAAARRQAVVEETAATRVEFFTMTRGED